MLDFLIHVHNAPLYILFGVLIISVLMSTFRKTRKILKFILNPIYRKRDSYIELFMFIKYFGVAGYKDGVEVKNRFFKLPIFIGYQDKKVTKGKKLVKIMFTFKESKIKTARSKLFQEVINKHPELSSIRKIKYSVKNGNYGYYGYGPY